MLSDTFNGEVKKDCTIAVGRSYEQMHEAFYSMNFERRVRLI
jgi:hypothetical protein